MKKSFIVITSILILISWTTTEAQKNNQGIRITYQTSFNGQVNPYFNTILEIGGDLAKVSYDKAKPEKNEPIQEIYLNYQKQTQTRSSLLKNNEHIYTVRNFSYLKETGEETETEKIAGYTCRKITTIINSNRIDIWYTKELSGKGTMQPNVGIPDGVVLKVVRNGQQTEQAVKIELLKKAPDLNFISDGEALSPTEFNYRIQQSRVLSVDIFTNQSIYFRNIPQPEQLNDTEVMQFANGSIVLKKVKLPEENDGYSIFTELSQYSEGDAYDRTGTVFMIPVDRKQSFLDGLMNGKENLPFYTDKNGAVYEGYIATENYLPPLELMRFYTSFGVRGYNHIEVAGYNWPDSVVFKQEVTDYAKILKGEVWIGAWIGNYSENGHNITLKIKYYPGKRNPEKEVMPLFTTLNIMEMVGQAYPEGLFRNDSLSFSFTTEKNLKNACIRYISTGHGGWSDGDEFTPKVNELFLNGEKVLSYIPWREDCGCYRELNPASGNFANGLSSSDLSRSGWCPGMVSYPVYIPLGDLKAGTHHLQLTIPVGDPAGSSHSYWCTSGVLIGENGN